MYGQWQALKLLTSSHGRAHVNDGAMQPWLIQIISCLSHQDLVLLEIHVGPSTAMQQNQTLYSIQSTSMS